MELTLKRYRLGDTFTDGVLTLPRWQAPGQQHIFTLERPWLPGQPGGISRQSCVPDGDYQLIRHRRPDRDDGTPGDDVLALRNPRLGVHYTEDDAGEGGRFLILIHAANWVHQVVGCIAPGLRRTIDDEGRPMVVSSRTAMAAIMAVVEGEEALELRIVTEPGCYPAKP